MRSLAVLHVLRKWAPNRAELRTFLKYCFLAAIYVTLGVINGFFVVAFWFGLAFLFLTAWVIPTLWRRLTR